MLLPLLQPKRSDTTVVNRKKKLTGCEIIEIVPISVYIAEDICDPCFSHSVKIVITKAENVCLQILHKELLNKSGLFCGRSNLIFYLKDC